MMRLPAFQYLAPRNLKEAAHFLSSEGTTAALLAGGTDLFPNMKRRHQMPKTLIGLRRVSELRGIRGSHIGAGTLLSEIERDARIRDQYPALWKAVNSISTPVLRNMGTIGGNICLDTRCTYYNQNYEWRRAINFCLKFEGKTCWVAPSSKFCLAVNSSDTAPVLCAIGARLRLVSKAGERTVDAADFFDDDGIAYLQKRPDEILVDVELPPPPAARSAAMGMALGSSSLGGQWRATYRKLRRRGAFDFPVLGVAARLDFAGDVVRDARIWLGAVSSAPIRAVESEEAVRGTPLSDETIARAAELAFRPAKPMDNTDFHLHWRKEMVKHFVRAALSELRS